MTDEELKKSMYLDFIDGLELSLVPNPDFRDNYAKARNNNTLRVSLGELKELNKRMNEGKDISGFTKAAFKRLNDIREMLDKDAFFSRSIGNQEFIDCLNEVKQSFNIAGDFLTNEKVLNNCEEDLVEKEALLNEARKNRLAVEKDQSLSIIEKSIKLAEATGIVDARGKAVEEARKIRNAQKAKLDASLKEIEKSLNIDEFINNVLQNVNKLDLLYRTSGLSLNPETSEKLGVAIRDLRDEVVGFKSKALADQVKFKEIMRSVGLMKVQASKEEISAEIEKYKNKIAELDKLDKEEKVEVDTPIEKIESKKEEPELNEEKPKTITEVEDLVKELKRLNPDVEIIEGIDGYSEGIMVEEPSKLVLPEGFKYTEGLGVNNKVDDVKPYINSFVKVKEKVKKAPLEEPTKKESKVPSGRLAYKRTRRAVVAPYAKAILCYGGIGGIVMAAAGAGLSPIGTAMVIGAGVGIVGQAIYNKMINAGAVEVPGAQFGNPNYELPLVGADIMSHAKALLKSLKKNKNRKKEETLDKVSEPEKVEVPEVVETPEVKQEVKAPEEKKNSLFENFKNLFGNSLNNEVDSLENEPKEPAVEELEAENKDLDVVNSPEINQILGEEYDLNEGRGGR